MNDPSKNKAYDVSPKFPCINKGSGGKLYKLCHPQNDFRVG